jgi:nitrite reductase/ring-hydroxylating ferredoxin subunit
MTITRSVHLCHIDELVDGESRGFDPLRAGHDTMFVVRRADRVRAWRDACPHINGAPMAWRKDAYLNAGRDRIVCSAHGAQFDIETGLCVLGPCIGQSLEPLKITSMSGALYLEMAPA